VPYDPGDIDDLAVVDGGLVIYLIPYSVVAGRSAIHLRAYGAYALPPVVAGTRQ
jgi:hypothetical protein